MFKFIHRIKELYNLSDRIMSLEMILREIDERIRVNIDLYLKNGMSSHIKEFEKKMQDMTFAYTENLDDTKSDYLKRYVEARMEGMQHQLTQLPYQMMALESKLTDVFLKLENIKDEQ